MKSSKFKRNLLIFGTYVIIALSQILIILYTHRIDLFSFIGLVILNAFVVEDIKERYKGSIYVEENWMNK